MKLRVLGVGWFGWGMKERTVTSDQLECKEEGGEDVHYHEGTLFTGRVEDFDENGQKLHMQLQ